MSASWAGNMRGPRVKSPLLLLLLLLLTGTALCQNDEDGAEPETEAEDVDTGDPEPEGDDIENIEPVLIDPEATSAPDPAPTIEGDPGESATEEHGSGQIQSTPEGNEYSADYSETTGEPNFTGTTQAVEDDGSGDSSLSTIIILIPVVLVVVIIGMIVCGIFINRRWNKKARNQEVRKEDPYLDGSSTEKVPMPMFEEDVPSVLELEMEELDQWMKKDGETADDSKHA